MKGSTAITKPSEMPIIIAREISKLNEKITKAQKEISLLEDASRPKLSLFSKTVYRWKMGDTGWSRVESFYKDFYMDSYDLDALINSREEKIKLWTKEILSYSQRLQETAKEDIEN